MSSKVIVILQYRHVKHLCRLRPINCLACGETITRANDLQVRFVALCCGGICFSIRGIWMARNMLFPVARSVRSIAKILGARKKLHWISWKSI